MTQGHQTELLSRRLLFDAPEKQLVRISPDGQWIAFQAPIDGVLNLWLAPVGTPESAQPLTNYSGRRIGPAVIWVHDNRHILIIRDKEGDENWCIWRVHIETKEAIPLTPAGGVKAYVQRRSRHFPSEILIAHNERDKRYFDIYRVDVATGASTLIETNEGFSGYFTDRQFRIRFAKRFTDRGEIEFLSRSEAGVWETIEIIPAEDSLTTFPIGYSQDESELYWIDSRGRDKAAATVQDVKTGSTRVLAEDQQADIRTLSLDPRTHRPIAAASMFERTKWQVLDSEYEEDFTKLASQFSGDLLFNGISDDAQKIILAHRQDIHPLEYYCYDRDLREIRKLFSAQSRLDGVRLTTMEPIVIPARDRLDLMCYLTRPPESEAAPVPMVLLVHGGPWNRDVWGLNPMHQWLANRGYAVLSVNFRGSTGFGKAFISAANLEWGGKMHDDLIDAVDWAVSQGIADPARVAIMGGSYGGYAALVGLTFTPEKFACAVDIVGISNLVTFIKAIPDYWQSWQSIWKTRMGDFTTESGRRFLEERSPLNHIDRIVRPLLIAQGANDVRVKVSESDQIVAAMQKRGIPVTYLLYPDEGHGLARPENRRSYTAIVEAFLSAHLGGRCEPVGDDFEDSSITFKAGRELIPGL
ncbi:MAG: S9 family peptidase [Pseudomonadota bacterium]